MPLAARSLEITVSDAPDLSGRVGAALMAIEEFLDEDSVHQALAQVAAPVAVRRLRRARPVIRRALVAHASPSVCGSVTRARRLLTALVAGPYVSAATD